MFLSRKKTLLAAISEVLVGGILGEYFFLMDLQSAPQGCPGPESRPRGEDSGAEVRNPWFGVDVAFLNRVDCDYRGYILEKRPKHCRNRAHRIRLGILERLKKKQTIKASSIEKLGPKENRDLKNFEI